MELTSFILGIVGLVLTIIFAEPVWRFLKSTMDNARRKTWSANLYKQGAIYNLRHFAFEKWSVHMQVDDEGGTTLSYEATIINLSDKLLTTFYLPFYSDTGGLSLKTLKVSARTANRPLPIVMDTLDANKKQGRLAISHVPPLFPGEHLIFSWKIVLPKLFQAGDEYFTWDVEVPYYEMRGTLEFTRGWRVLYAKWKKDFTDHRPPLKIRNRSIQWGITLPPTGTRLHLLFGLEKVQQE